MTTQHQQSRDAQARRPSLHDCAVAVVRLCRTADLDDFGVVHYEIRTLLVDALHADDCTLYSDRVLCMIQFIDSAKDDRLGFESSGRHWGLLEMAEELLDRVQRYRR